MCSSTASQKEGREGKEEWIPMRWPPIGQLGWALEPSLSKTGPQDSEGEEEEEEGGMKRRRIAEAEESREGEEAGDVSGTPAVAEGSGAMQLQPPSPTVSSPSYQPTTPPALSENSHPMSGDEPEAEVIQSSTGGSNGTSHPNQNDINPQPMDYQDPQVQNAIQQSLDLGNRLDDLPRHGRPFRWRTTNSGVNPYWTQEKQEIFLETVEEDPTESEEEESVEKLNSLLQQTVVGKKKDYWEVDFEKGELRRIHQKKRKEMFNPLKSPWMPISERSLQAERKTCVEFTGGSREKKEGLDSWRWDSKPKEGSWWKGQTIFYFNRAEVQREQVSGPAAYVVQKKGQDEVDPRNEDAEGQQRWKESDLAEWNKVVNSGAVEVLSLEESRRIRQELQGQKKEKRILPTKTARRYKPADLPGHPASRKSRVCLRGDLDPDILELERFSPTINTLNFNLLLQTAANAGMGAVVADFSNAFCQSKPLNRPNGDLYFSPPKDGIEGVHPEILVRIISGVYGLVDAPLHWRKSLVEDLHSLGYCESKLDPCIFKSHSRDGKLLGAVAVEVDDLFMIGNEEHESRMRRLKDKYKFGKWVELRKEKDGCSFNGRRIRQEDNGGFLVDMEKFINERLNPIEVEKGRASKKKEEATDEERHAARAACGALNWLSKEGRPDAAGPSSLMASRLGVLCVEDLLSINEVIKGLKANADLTIKIQPLRQMRLSVITDASFANSGFHSQGGHLVVAHEKELAEGELVTANIITWRSGKLQRVVNSTLAAETQSLSRGLGDLLWAMVTLEEFTNGNFEIHSWPEKMKASEALALASSQSEGLLKESLAIVDAKSLFDYLSKETVGGGQDKRTAIEIQIIRQDLNSIDGSIRWVDHSAMLADGLTKLKGSNAALYRVLGTGKFSIKEEATQMVARQKARAQGQTSSDIRRFGVKENFGSVNHDCCFEHGHSCFK